MYLYYTIKYGILSINLEDFFIKNSAIKVLSSLRPFIWFPKAILPEQ